MYREAGLLIGPLNAWTAKPRAEGMGGRSNFDPLGLLTEFGVIFAWSLHVAQFSVTILSWRA
jgi:hypothetical protein